MKRVTKVGIKNISYQISILDSASGGIDTLYEVESKIIIIAEDISDNWIGGKEKSLVLEKISEIVKKTNDVIKTYDSFLCTGKKWLNEMDKLDKITKPVSDSTRTGKSMIKYVVNSSNKIEMNFTKFTEWQKSLDDCIYLLDLIKKSVKSTYNKIDSLIKNRMPNYLSQSTVNGKIQGVINQVVALQSMLMTIQVVYSNADDRTFAFVTGGKVKKKNGLSAVEIQKRQAMYKLISTCLALIGKPGIAASIETNKVGVKNVLKEKHDLEKLVVEEFEEGKALIKTVEWAEDSKDKGKALADFKAIAKLTKKIASSDKLMKKTIDNSSPAKVTKINNVKSGVATGANWIGKILDVTKTTVDKVEENGGFNSRAVGETLGEIAIGNVVSYAIGGVIATIGLPSVAVGIVTSIAAWALDERIIKPLAVLTIGEEKGVVEIISDGINDYYESIEKNVTPNWVSKVSPSAGMYCEYVPIKDSMPKLDTGVTKLK